MKLAIKAELAYSFAPSTQVIANIEASQSSDQTILSELLDIQPQVQLLSDTTPHGDRSIRAAFSGEVTILYQAVVENHQRQLLPTSGRQHVWSDLPERRACVPAAQPLLSVGQVHAVCPARIRWAPATASRG